jgi:DNA-binding transcriptional LysR family regulator
MNASRPSLAELVSFATVAAHKSFRQAADELRVSPSTLSHTIRTLETRLGVRLLHRTTRSVAMTEVGQALLSRVQPLVQEFDAALDDIDNYRSTPSGTLRINSSLIGARVLLQLAVPTFLARYPEMHLDLVTEGRLVDIVAEGFDAGVRLSESVPRDMVAVAFGGSGRFVAVAAPAYLKKYGVPKAPLDLLEHSCIRYRMRNGRIYHWEFERRGQAVEIDARGHLSLDEERLMIEAAIEGVGIAFVAERTASEAIARRRLSVVLDEWCTPFPGLCLYYPGHRQVPAGLRAFVDVLKGGSGQIRAKSSAFSRVCRRRIRCGAARQVADICA